MESEPVEKRHVDVEKEGRIVTLTISRPEALNALNVSLLRELECVLYDISRDKDVDVVIITGEGKAFVAGADIAEMAEMAPLDAQRFSELGQRVFGMLEEMPQVVICAINGYALGGGCELALSCDIRIASEKAKFGQPEVNLGVTPGFGGTQRLPRLVGRGMAKYLVLSGRMIDAVDAQRIGLVEMVVPSDNLMDEAKRLAQEIASKGTIAVRIAKQMIQRGVETDLISGLALEREGFALTFSTYDQKEGMKAFMEKRKPEFKRE